MTPDAAYRNLFSHSEVVADLLSGYAAAEWIDELDLNSLEPANRVFVSDDLRERRSDIIWRLKWRGDTWLYVYVLLEFQRSVDRFMAVRMLTYVALLYQDLIKAQQVVEAKAPPVLPIVLYNGVEPWTAPVALRDVIHPGPNALAKHLPDLHYVFLDENRMQASGDLTERNLAAAIFRLEQSKNERDLKRAVDAIHGWLGAPERAHLARAFSEWIGKVLVPTHLHESPDPGTISLDGIRSMLAEKVESWVKEWKAEGVAEGRVEGRLAQLLELCQAGTLSHEQVIELIDQLVATGEVTPEQQQEVLSKLEHL